MERTIIFGIITLFSFGFLSFNLYRFSRIVRLAQPERRTDRFWLRIKNMLRIALLQSKILREPFAGAIHVGIFWGFLVLLFSASESVFQGFFPSFSWSFLHSFYSVITVSTDVFCIIVIVAIIFASLRRYAFKVKRLQGNRNEMLDAIVVLGSIFIIVTALLLENAARIRIYGNREWAFLPISSLLSNIFSSGNSNFFYQFFWWLHILWIYFFMNYLYYSKHFHVFTSVQNVFFREPEKFFKLNRIDFENESLEKFGVVDFEDLSWKSIHDSFSCTHCGRCDSVCPANITGKVLSPRDIIIQIRKRAVEKGTIVLKQQKFPNYELKNQEKAAIEKKFIGDYENVEGLWQCLTCGACMNECPISIEHLHPIIGMRRSQVMMEANFPPLLQNVFSSLENNGAPWQFPSTERAVWADGLGVQIAAEDPEFEYLFWVGCAGSFDERAKKISIAFAKLLQKAGVSFAILAHEEMCNGDVARRAGNEYLANFLISTNIETLNRYNVKKILTTCPHCFNIFKNEYPDFGGNFEVYHHTQFLYELIQMGKLKLKKNSAEILAYHDSCYLGRYNNVYEPPREILKLIYGSNVREPRHSHNKGTCCGAGGGMLFLEETKGKRINIHRTEELMETGANTFASNCPFCMTMLTDGVKANNKDEQIRTKDIAEIVLENLVD